MTDLSPQTQAVLDALCMDELNGPQRLMARAQAVAVLRAVAAIETHNPWGGRIESVGSMWLRDQILAIATELENHQ